jgi:hypothetical protein
MYCDVDNRHSRGLSQNACTPNDTRALGFLKPSRRLARARALMKFSHFDSDSTVARCDTNVRLIHWFDLTGRNPAKGTAHLFDQSHFLVLLDLPSH